jgi:hypothetical protein
MRKNYRIVLILGSVFILLSGCSGFTDRTAAVSVCFDGSSLCRSADSADGTLTVKLINSETKAVIGTETKTFSSSDSQTEISFTAQTGLSVYLHAELTQSGTVVASGDSDTVTVRTETEIALAMQWKKGSVTVSVTQGNTDSCAFSLTVTSPDSAAAEESDSTGLILTAGYAYTVSLGAEISGTAASYDSSVLTLYSGTDSVLSSTTGTVTVPAYLEEGTYRLYMEIHVDGIYYTGYETIIVK